MRAEDTDQKEDALSVDPLPARDLSQGEPHTFGTLDGTVLLTIDTDKFDFHITAKAGYDPKSMCLVLTQAEWWGLEVIEDEPPVILPSGSVRQYLTPIIPLDDVREVETRFSPVARGLVGAVAATAMAMAMHAAMSGQVVTQMLVGG